jgi:arylformamidase
MFSSSQKTEATTIEADNPETKKKMYYDLTAQITEKMVVFPGDPKFKSEDISSLNEGAHYGLCHMHLGNHTGTHIDFPSHVIKNAKSSSDFEIKDLIGQGLIIEVPDEEKSITRAFVHAQNQIKKNDFVFFKTANSKLSKYAEFNSKYVYIEPEAANALLEKGIKVVGIDYISVDNYEAEELPVHRTLLSNDVLIVEGLELNNVPIGRCKIYIIPNNIPAMDGLPARVLAKM